MYALHTSPLSFLHISGAVDLGFSGRGGRQASWGVPGFCEEGLVNQAFDYSSFLKDIGSFITYTRHIIKDTKDTSQVYYVNIEIMTRNLHIVLWLKGGGDLGPLNPSLGSATAYTWIKIFIEI